MTTITKNLLGLLCCGLLSLLNFNTLAQSTPQFDEAIYQSMEWRSIGPYRGGRSCAVAGVSGKPNLYYMGTTGGGVWRTRDGGRQWENISDGFFGGSIGSIAVSEYDHNVIYVGGGEVTVRGNVSHGDGVWKSVDAGKTWTQMGLKSSRHIARLRIHPRNPETVYAAVMGDLYTSNQQRGVFRSKDGGASWEKILYVNPDVGAVDLCMDPNNPRILYATTWRIRRTPYSLSSGGQGSGIWKSTDGGDNWEEITRNEGLPKDTVGIAGITVSPVNSERVWAIIEAKDGGVFRSDDSGKTWKKLNDKRNLRQRAWYYTRIYADTQDEDKVYVLNVRYHRSKDGGKTFQQFNSQHSDHHDLWIAPENPDRMVIADDGGAQVTYDGGETWSTYHNQPTAQFYRVTTDNHFPYRIYAAQQDNSTVRIMHRSPGSEINERHWESTAGCECGHIAIDPKNNDIVYGGCYDGYLQRLDHGIDQRRAINVWPDNPMGHGAEGMRYRFQWNFPLFFSPHDPKKLYTASNHLHVSYDEGQSWEIISPDLTRNDPSKLGSSGGPITKDNTSVEYYCTIFAAIESPRVKDLLWVGSDDGLLHLSRDGGQNWTQVNPPNMPEWIMINSLEADPFNDGGLYVAATMYKSGDFQPYLYRTKDFGKTWKKITKGIDKEHFTRVVRADPERQGLLYAGTESGMYVSFDDGDNWQPFQLNLPIVPITDLAVKENNLVAATQGRSIWVIDDLTPLHQLKKGDDAKAVHLFTPKPTYRMDGRQNKKVKNAGMNHPGGVMVHYFVKNLEDSTKVSLSFMEKEGTVIRTFSNTAKEKKDKLKVEKGANRFVWNMTYPEAKKFKGMILWWGSLNGPKARPGDYQVKLTVDGEETIVPFSILKDPRTPATPADFQKQFDFVRSNHAKLSEAHQAIIDIRDIREQLKNYRQRLKGKDTMKPLLDAASAIDSSMTTIEETLYQTQNRSPQDPLNFPIRLTNKLAHLNSLTQGDFPPTDQAVAVQQELTAAIDMQLAAFRKIKEEELPKFNRMVKEMEVDAIILGE
ncbi:MAG: glycosyl hydrolase [Bacteroidota bacterium]